LAEVCAAAWETLEVAVNTVPSVAVAVAMYVVVVPPGEVVVAVAA
jgi:hypothetical protein